MRCRVCGRRRYFSIGRRRTQEALLGYLDGLTRAGGLRPWQEVPEARLKALAAAAADS
eukprot:COSAG01_NODE_16141_length_1266_cov_1.774636_1_plen_57_part_10